MTMRPEVESWISEQHALERLRENENEYHRRRRVCQCKSHRRLRRYLGVWQCMLCLRPRQSA